MSLCSVLYSKLHALAQCFHPVSGLQWQPRHGPLQQYCTVSGYSTDGGARMCTKKSGCQVNRFQCRSDVTDSRSTLVLLSKIKLSYEVHLGSISWLTLGARAATFGLQQPPMRAQCATPPHLRGAPHISRALLLYAGGGVGDRPTAFPSSFQPGAMALGCFVAPSSPSSIPSVLHRQVAPTACVWLTPAR